MFFLTMIWGLAVLGANAAADKDSASPLVIPASEYFEGNDGPWSTFDLRVGTPEQHVRVLVSTASPESMVVLSSLGCSQSVFDKVPSDCAVSRGNLFTLNQTSTWTDMGTYGINQNGVGLEANLGYSQRAQFGLDKLGVGLNGPSLENQTIAGIATPEPFYLGIFGLNNQPVNFTSLGNYSSPSFLTTLKENNAIPSLSWSYTAGAQYRLKQVYGQLIFSGYDTSRFEENSVTFSMADDITRDLVVALHSISYSGSSSATLLSDAINIYIDSTDPNIWLPADVCDAFEQAFDLTLDQDTGLYLVNETHHNTLLNSDAEVSFRLSDVKTGGDTVSITLPYAAFGLTAEYPLVDNTSHYFPLKRADNATQYTLGRVFLQEAYLSADYEHKVFNVSANVWHQGAKENIVTIGAETSGTDKGGGGGGGGGDSSSSLSDGALAGIVVGAVVGGLLVIAAIAVVLLRKRRKWMKAGFAVEKARRDPDDSVSKGPLFHPVAQGSPQSTENDSVLVSANGSSIPRASAGASGPSSTSPLKQVTTSENTESSRTSGLEGDENYVKPKAELDSGQLTKGPQPGVDDPRIYELPGSPVVPEGRGDEHSPRDPYTAGCFPIP